MKKMMSLMAGLLAFVALAMLPSCQNAATIGGVSADGKGGNGGGTGGGSGGGEISGLYRLADGYDIAPWNCWDNCRLTAEVTSGADGGARMVSNKGKCDGTYFGVNLAAGTGSGANSDIDGKGFTKIVFKVRGTIPANLLKFYAIAKAGPVGPLTGKVDTNGNPVLFALDDAIYTKSGDYNETTWTTVTVDVKGAATMSSAFICMAENGCGSPLWVEVKDIDWQTADGTSVVPEYIE